MFTVLLGLMSLLLVSLLKNSLLFQIIGLVVAIFNLFYISKNKDLTSSVKISGTILSLLVIIIFVIVSMWMGTSN